MCELICRLLPKYPMEYWTTQNRVALLSWTTRPLNVYTVYRSVSGWRGDNKTWISCSVQSAIKNPIKSDANLCAINSFRNQLFSYLLLDPKWTITVVEEIFEWLPLIKCMSFLASKKMLYFKHSQVREDKSYVF